MCCGRTEPLRPGGAVESSPAGTAEFPCNVGLRPGGRLIPVRQRRKRLERLNQCQRANRGSIVPPGRVSEHNRYPAFHAGLLSTVPPGQKDCTLLNRDFVA
jgi:hypothetical protein